MRDGELLRMKTRFARLFVLFCFTGFLAANISAQHSTKSKLPRVGLIKDYDSVVGQLPDGCGNHLVTFSGRLFDKGNVYISRPDGDGAAMNLNGRDTKLKLRKTVLVFD